VKIGLLTARARLAGIVILCWITWCIEPQAQGEPAATNEIRIVELQGIVEVSPAGARTWVLTQTNQLLYPFDRLRTGTNSRVALRWSDNTIVPFGPSTELEVLPPHAPGAHAGLHLIRGIVSFFHRDKPGRIRVITRGAVAGVEGTEFVIGVDASDRTLLSVIDGRVRFGNEQGTLVLTNGQQAHVDVGAAPVRTAGFIANNVLQWSFYYPAVLELSELPLTADERSALAESMEAYQSGDLLQALERYPAGRSAVSDAERVYFAALLLSVGKVNEAETNLTSVAGASERLERLSGALRVLVASVKRQEMEPQYEPQLASELLAASYYEQSRALPNVSLPAALKLARKAVTNVPQSGFAWARVAELEFSFGRRGRAEEALERALELAPRNAQALALKGYLAAARGRPGEAVEWFNRALGADSALGNAWLGRGLSRTRMGDVAGGREDLLVAAALEPQRAELRNYLGKAYASGGDLERAMGELEIAKRLDPDDPTPWLYSALVNFEDNRINEAVRDLERSKEMNDNRSVYRSQLLLDQDEAVRSASLARIYRDAGMEDVAFREAASATSADYGNYSAHLFLADSLNPGFNLVSRRYESASFKEFLLANLLAPAGAGTFSPALSQAEYSRLLERSRLGLSSRTEYWSRGRWAESGAQYGNFEKFSYDLYWDYLQDPGQRINNEVELRRFGVQMKLQLTPEDSLFARVSTVDLTSGDLFQYYDPAFASRELRVHEKQEPLVLIGYHREWNPGVHTLVAVSRLQDTYRTTNAATPIVLVARSELNDVEAVLGSSIRERFRGEAVMYSAEVQQIWQTPATATVVGGRFQYGELDSEVIQNNPNQYVEFFPMPPDNALEQDLGWLMRRWTAYGYHSWRVFEPLQLVGGVTYDRLEMPENFRMAPLSADTTTIERVSPKAGVIWTPLKDTTVRFAYTRSLGGVTFEQSHQLEPSQVAGFVQSYRSIIPENEAGALSGARFETYGLSLEQRFKTGTYLAIHGEMLYSDLRRVGGAYDVLETEDFALPSKLREELDYREHSLTFTANQLLGAHWSLGGQYRLSQAVLKNDFVDIPDQMSGFLVNFVPRQRRESVLHQLTLHAVFNHECGFFARSEALWLAQSDESYAPTQPGDDFWQFNVFAGYRFPRRRAEIQLGILNLGDQDYRLRTLNLHSDLPRERTFAARLQFDF